MDNNKLKMLQSIGYRVKKTCHFCKHYQRGQSPNWGTCGKFDYSHLKHSDSTRQLSVHRSGFCHNFAIDTDELNVIHGYKDLVEK